MSNPYDYAIDPNGNETANKVLKFVGAEKLVLELGTAGGVMTRELVKQHCEVWGVEYNPMLAEQAAPSCKKMIVGDIESLDIKKIFHEQKFDVILAADVLEHLRDPYSVLTRLSPLVAEGGCIVLSLPNIAFSGLLAGLLQGRFQYREKGLLDQTHLRFFTRNSIEEMLLTQGWMPIQWEAQRVDISATEFLLDWLALPNYLRESIQNRPDSDVYQFIVKAVPARQEAWETALGERYSWIQQRVSTMEAENQRLKSENSRTRTELNLVNKAFSEAREIIAKFEKIIEEQKQTISFQNEKITLLDEKIRELLDAQKQGAEISQKEIEKIRKEAELHPLTALVHRILPPKN